MYWTDLGLSVGIGWTAFVLSVNAPPFSASHVALFVVATLALYRAAAFVHELAHVKRGRLELFRWVWNAACGFPLMIPSFMYRGVHNDHHKQGLYGTHADGEYLPFVLEGRARIVGYVFFAFLAPLMLFARLVLVVPLAWSSRRFRDYLWTHLSSLQIDMSYERPPFSARDEGSWRLQELCTFLVGGSVVGLSVAGVLPWRVPATWYVMEVTITVMNTLRTLAAHRYRNPPDETLDIADQFLDSVNIPGR